MSVESTAMALPGTQELSLAPSAQKSTALGLLSEAERCTNCGKRQGWLTGLRGFGFRASGHEARCRKRTQQQQNRRVASRPALAAPEANPAVEHAVQQAEAPQATDGAAEEHAGQQEIQVLDPIPGGMLDSNTKIEDAWAGLEESAPSSMPNESPRHKELEEAAHDGTSTKTLRCEEHDEGTHDGPATKTLYYEICDEGAHDGPAMKTFLFEEHEEGGHDGPAMQTFDREKRDEGAHDGALMKSNLSSAVQPSIGDGAENRCKPSGLLVSVAGGAVVGGSGGGAIGLATGAVAGSVCGAFCALLTFGMSIPIGAAVGGASGFGVGATAGGVVGGSAGWALHSLGNKSDCSTVAAYKLE